jgi:hypothetical protein
VPGLTPELQDLIARVFDSVESVEIVLLLRRSPHTYWGVPAVAEQLGIRPEVAQAKLSALADLRILKVGEQTGAFRYAPDDTKVSANLDDLAAAYAHYRVSVVNTIYSANLERLRAFSNAFRVK